MLSRCFLDFSVGVRASVIGLSQISSFSLVLPTSHGKSYKSDKNVKYTRTDAVSLWHQQ